MSSITVDHKPERPHRFTGKPPGRPCLLTSTVQATFVKLIREGNNIKTACQGAGFSEDAYYSYKRQALEEFEGRGQKGDGRFGVFINAVKKAEAEFRAEMIAVIRKCALRNKPGSWIPAMTLLERTWPEEYAQAPQLRVTGTIQHDHTVKGIMDRVALYEEAQKPKALAPGIIEGEKVEKESLTFRSRQEATE